ncbi:MAG TPA: LytTR family DNA-binding domain-containing protein [Gemmatimonadales bacterium]|nr:LytTR family DNA-binding domain-containing protein [Gemmatimonadales bacterium]
MTLRAVIADDEPLARRGLAAWLAEAGDVTLVGQARNGDEAVALVRAERPDLLFLDVQMPGRDGLGVLEALGGELPPAVVFVTAYDQYALRAFDHHAVDYLLKPVDEERFRVALARARERVAARRPDERLRALLAEWHPAAPEWLERIPVRIGAKVTLVPVAEVEWFEAADNYVRVHAGGRRHAIRETMKELAARLDPRRFARTHRGAIVALGRIRELEALPSGDYRVKLASGAVVPLSRTYVAEFERRVGRKL